MPHYQFYQIDVFTNLAFGGNPLAVFPNADGLTQDDMQRLAREMNLSETTFVFEPTVPGADYKVKIFTPQTELPFAGHPVIGTQWLLAHIGRTKLTAPSVTVKFELGVGIRAATLHVENGQVSRVVMDHQKPSFGEIASLVQVTEIARSLGLPTEAITDTGWPVQAVSTGIRQLFVPVRSLLEVQQLSPAKINADLLSQLFEVLDPVERCNGLVMVFCKDTTYPDSTVHARAFGPAIGIPEDPATGSASGGLGGYLVRHGVVETTAPTTYIVSEQGIEMGRYSRITIEVDGTPENVEMVRVGGQVTPLIEGTVSWS